MADVARLCSCSLLVQIQNLGVRLLAVCFAFPLHAVENGSSGLTLALPPHQHHLGLDLAARFSRGVSRDS